MFISKIRLLHAGNLVIVTAFFIVIMLMWISISKKMYKVHKKAGGGLYNWLFFTKSVEVVKKEE